MRKFIGILFVALFLLVACSDQDSTSTDGKHPEDTIESQDQAENQPESAIEENGTETEEESKKNGTKKITPLKQTRMAKRIKRNKRSF